MTEAETEQKFPEGFRWGCATSAHQIEGGLLNDWSAWEQSAGRLADLRSRGLDPRNFISGAAANSYVDNNADLACLRELGANAYRFSLDWSRLEPTEGDFDESALEYYRELIKKLRADKIEPFVTLWHWPLPLWLAAKGGWASPASVIYFERFVGFVAERLGGEVNFWITLNEPMVYATQSYLLGVWPPQRRNPLIFLAVRRHLTAAHRAAYRKIKSLRPTSQVGIAKNNIYFEAGDSSFINRCLKRLGEWWWNERFLNRIKDCQDFIGLNYYFHNYVDHGFGRPFAYERKSDLDWGLHPEGIYHLLRDLRRYNRPIYITENGLADQGDQHRSWYIAEILKNVRRALDEGVPVRGYFHWSLIDNFEWAEGYRPRFGLYEIDYKTFTRRARPSAQFYADICRHNRI